MYILIYFIIFVATVVTKVFSTTTIIIKETFVNEALVPGLSEELGFCT